jgi:Holliday junction resolvase RusA-like endonuclease
MPMPPSVNGAYATNFSTKRRFKSKDYQLFESSVLHWTYVNAETLAKARELTGRLLDGQALRVDIVFYFPRSKILTKATKSQASRLKRLDVDNRIKAAFDVLAKILGVDDCMFFEGSFRKVCLKDEHMALMDVDLSVINFE